MERKAYILERSKQQKTKTESLKSRHLNYDNKRLVYCKQFQIGETLPSIVIAVFFRVFMNDFASFCREIQGKRK